MDNDQINTLFLLSFVIVIGVLVGMIAVSRSRRKHAVPTFIGWFLIGIACFPISILLVLLGDNDRHKEELEQEIDVLRKEINDRN